MLRFGDPGQLDPAGETVVDDLTHAVADVRDIDAGVVRDLAEDAGRSAVRRTHVEVAAVCVDFVIAGTALGSARRVAVRAAADTEIDIAADAAVEACKGRNGKRTDDAVAVCGVRDGGRTFTDGGGAAVDLLDNEDMVRIDGQRLRTGLAASREAVQRIFGVQPVGRTVDDDVLTGEFSRTGRREPGTAASAVCDAGGRGKSGVRCRVDVDMDAVEAVVHDACRATRLCLVARHVEYADGKADEKNECNDDRNEFALFDMFDVHISSSEITKELQRVTF